MNRPLRTLRILMACGLASSLGAACSSGGGWEEGTPHITEIVTTPAGAQVMIEGYGSCESPCTFSHDGPRMVTIAKAGFRKVEMEIAPGRDVVQVELQLVAPSGDVDATALPDL